MGLNSGNLKSMKTVVSRTFYQRNADKLETPEQQQIMEELCEHPRLVHLKKQLGGPRI